MASTINASTSSGLVNTADTSGVLQLQTASTAAVTIDASQKVGVGKTPSSGIPQRLQIKQPDAVYSGISIEKSDDDSYLGIGYWSTSAAWTFQPTYQSTGSYLPLAFATGGSERMRINAGAPILCLAGGSTTATGTGIAFPATQNPSSDANTLDDYEEGTWTPTVSGNATYTNQTGIYVKVGRMVYAAFDFAINVIGSGSTSNLSGFPFTSTGAGMPYTGSTSYWAGLTTNIVYLGFYLQNNATSALFVGNSGTAGTTIQYNSFAVMGSGSRIIGAIVYETAS
jgi:hypothetical protein